MNWMRTITTFAVVASFVATGLPACAEIGTGTGGAAADITANTSNDLADSEVVTVERPPLSALIAIDRNVDPFMLDADGQRQMGLAEATKIAVSSNLDISLSATEERIKAANFGAALGKFLPDLNLRFNYNYLKGAANVPFGSTPDKLRFNNPLIITGAGFKYHGYRGGRILFGALSSRNTLRAARHARKATLSDTLQDVARLYYDLVLQEAVLQIRVQAVETSVSELTLRRDLKQGGKGTNLEVLQAETQLSQDRQNLIDQQVARREAAIRLAEFLNLPQNIDITPATTSVQKIRLVSNQMNINSLLKAAIDLRPELKQYEELRLAAKKQIVVASAKLQPSFDFNGNVLGIGETLSNQSEPRAIAQGLTPLSLAVAGPRALTRNRQITGLFTLGYAINWNLEGMGTVDALNVQAARLEARKAHTQQMKVLNQVTSEVRRSYLKMLKTERKIEESISQVRSSQEELKLAQLRFQYGLGKNIDVLRARQDYTSALIEKARAIVNFDIAQAEMLRDAGLVSSATLNATTPLLRQ